MRVNEYDTQGNIDSNKQKFNQWVLDVGDRKVHAKIKEGEDEPSWIHIPETISEIVNQTFSDFITRQKDEGYLRERAILTPKNDDADEINDHMFKMLGGRSVTYKSSEEVCKASTDALDQE